MKTLLKLLALAIVAGAASGCAYVSSANPGMSTATGEAWYTKDTYFIFYLGTDVYYCPKGGGVCYMAEVAE
ncbi:MAG: hypothetical protein JW940_38390 [Polyangiaceae bacterium]|nr:hypothetical protein [Polyangiaceae bacterium]